MGKAFKQLAGEPLQLDKPFVGDSRNEVQPKARRTALIRQHARRAAHAAAKGKLAYHQGIAYGLWVDLPRCRQNPQGDGQIEPRTGLSQRTRRQVHHDLFRRHDKAARTQGRLNALPRFLNGGIGHAHDGKSGNTIRDNNLDGNGNGLNPANGGALQRKGTKRHGYSVPNAFL